MIAKNGALAGLIKGEVLYAAPMAGHTSFRVGWPVDFLTFPADLDDLRTLLCWCQDGRVPYFILGKGTNLLVRDGGIRGMAINLSRGFTRLQVFAEDVGGAAVIAEAGESLSRFVDFSWRNNLDGLEFAAGIPGSVGGGIFMNAGAFRREMKDVLAWALTWLTLLRNDFVLQQNQFFSVLRQNLSFGGWILAGRIVGQLNSASSFSG